MLKQLVNTVLTAQLVLGLTVPNLGSLFKNDFKSVQAPLALSNGHGSVSLISQAEFEEWLDNHAKFSFNAMIENIGGWGHDLINEDILPGLVIASPSKKDPNYFFQWTRDAAIAINLLISEYRDIDGKNTTLKEIIEDYLLSSKKIQRTDNPSGTFESLDGLGEPKFQVNGAPFTENWGRPQGDGPALRANSVINYIRTSLKVNDTLSLDDFKALYLDLIKPDLDYVSKRWSRPGFDLWEEINGHHFFTLMVQLRALTNGASIAQQFEDYEGYEKYVTTGQNMTNELTEYYFDPKKGHLVETRNLDYRNGLDSALFLASIYSFNSNNLENRYDAPEVTNPVYPPFSDEILSSLSALVADMRTRFPINERRLKAFEIVGADTDLVGVGIGRYPEDIYNGVSTSLGNPWFLCTATIAHILYIHAEYLGTRNSDFILTFSDLVRPFYEPFLGQLDDWKTSTFSISRKDKEYEILIDKLIRYGDSCLDVIREHESNEGYMSEQFSRYDGWMRGAENLTWSYGAFWAAHRQRKIALREIHDE